MRPRSFLTLLLLSWLLTRECHIAGEEPVKSGVFQQPRVQANYIRLQLDIQQLFKKGQYAEAEKKCRQAIELAPDYPGAYYNLACARAGQNDPQGALDSLHKAVERGFNDLKLLKEDPDLAGVRDKPPFAGAMELAAKAKPDLLWPAQVEPGLAKNGEVWVAEANTQWDIRHGLFRVSFKLPPLDREVPVIKGHGQAGELLRTWFTEGTAAGHHGDFYDNHDGDHSNMAYQQFPQLTRIEFSKEAKDLRLHSGLQNHLFYNGIVLGNSSTAIVGGPYWRSQPRLAYSDARRAQFLYNQYVNNHLYLYPEHRDHDPGHNGKGGYGDVYPANTPYVLISQGSSGSDRPFLDAVACILVALRPEVKKFLAENGALMPAVQMIFRSGQKTVKGPEDYLTGKAHPTVFEGGNIDLLQMVKLAHEIKREEVPPLVRLRVVKEDQPALGRDYFDFTDRGEKLFDTPAAIARVMRSTQYLRRMVVSAEDSRDLNKRPLKWHWVVLRGDPTRIAIKPLNEASSVVELSIPYHERRAIAPGSNMESNRVDIGVFVHNGKHYSAPAFVTFFSLDHEKRVYDDKHRLQSVDYADNEASSNYVDPLVGMQKNWRDEYHHDEQGRLLGWTRHRGQEKQSFTADGELIVKKDDRGRVLETQKVRYAPRPRKDKAPELEQQTGEEK